MLQNQAAAVFVGNLASDPELRFTPSGAAVCQFRIMVNFPVKDGDKWKDGEPLSVDVVAWRTLAENCAESLTKGNRVIVQGTVQPNNYEKDGTKVYRWKLVAETVGIDLTFATAKPVKTGPAGSRSGGGDEWSKAKPAASGQRPAASASSFTEEPPF